MIRYVIAVWDSLAAADISAASTLRAHYLQSADSWSLDFSAPGIFVFCIKRDHSADSAIPIRDHLGLILGTMYPSMASSGDQAPKSIALISPHLASSIAKSRGRNLITECWGSYILVLYEAQNRMAFLMRSPMSHLPCFRSQIANVAVLFSFVDDFLELGCQRLTLNWDSLVGQAALGDHFTNETGLNEISSVGCGECLAFHHDHVKTHYYWLPGGLQKTKLHLPFSEAARALRKVTEYCVNAWASDHRKILLMLSGGLDSSIVLACLRRSPTRPDVEAVTFYSRAHGDERRYARCMAEAGHCNLIEVARNDAMPFEHFSNCRRTVKPVIYGSVDSETIALGIAKDINASALLNGELGDNLFGSTLAIGMLVECLLDYGFSRKVLAVILEYATLSRLSVWRSIRFAIAEAIALRAQPDFSMHDLVKKHRASDPSIAITLVREDRLERYEQIRHRFIHPWYIQGRLVAAGSQDLLNGMIAMTSPCFDSPFKFLGGQVRISPLISQPLAEFALRTPTYFHIKNAQNRSLARAAFSDALPKLILDRGEGKGGPHLWIGDYLRRNANQLREFLLDGLVVKHRLLDSAKLEAALSPEIMKCAAMAEQVLEAVYFESWLRQWDAVGVR